MGFTSSKNKKPEEKPITSQDPVDNESQTSENLRVNTQIASEINGILCSTKVTQIFSNRTKYPLELKIYIIKNPNIIFSSFESKIGNSIKVKSKIIKEEKAKEKYENSIASGKAAIFVTHDPIDENKIIIHMGNIPPHEDISFTSFFISPIETSNNRCEIELFRNLPIFQGKNGEIYQNSELKGEIIIKSNNKIINIQKNILMKELKIIQEKSSSENPYIYTIKYEINQLPLFDWNKPDYIPSSKIYFDLDTKQPLALVQESNKEPGEKFCFIQYRFKLDKMAQDEDMFPSLFIFLLDQSGSMSGDGIRTAKKALIFFLQSIPVGSYYQIIGFGSSFRKYDKTPKEYNKKNIKESIDIINNLTADLGGTDIYLPLKDIYDSKDYDDINLPRNIFLLTDGEVLDKKKVLNLIEKNNDNFVIYSIGIGRYFDEDLIKNAGIIGKGNYNFCKDNNKLNSVIVSEINKCCNPFITNINFDCNLDNNKISNIIPRFLRENDSIKLYYIIIDKNIDNIKLKMNCRDYNNKTKEENYIIIPEKMEEGDDLSKLIMYNYINNNKGLSKEEKIKLALKYQIFIEGTSLFAEVELDEKITEKMKLEILGDKKQNESSNTSNSLFPVPIHTDDVIVTPPPYNDPVCPLYNIQQIYDPIRSSIDDPFEHNAEYNNYLNNMDDPTGPSGNNPFGDNIFDELIKQEENNCEKNVIDPFESKINDPFENNNDDEKVDQEDNNCEKNMINPFESKINDPFGDEIDGEKNINKPKIIKSKEDEFNEMINSQDFIEGFWEENEYTKKLIEKYEKEYKIIKEIKNKNIDAKVALTILVIYYINKEHSEALNDLILVIKKAKLFIKKVTKDSYDNIIKEINVN